MVINPRYDDSDFLFIFDQKNANLRFGFFVSKLMFLTIPHQGFIKCYLTLSPNNLCNLGKCKWHKYKNQFIILSQKGGIYCFNCYLIS